MVVGVRPPPKRALAWCAECLRTSAEAYPSNRSDAEASSRRPLGKGSHCMLIESGIETLGHAYAAFRDEPAAGESTPSSCRLIASPMSSRSAEVAGLQR